MIGAIPPRRLLWTAVALAGIAAAIEAYRLSRMTVVLGSTEGRWVYVYLQGYEPRFAWVFLQVALICGAALLVPLRVVGRHEWWSVVLWLIVALGVQGLIRHETRYTFEQIFVSDGSNSFYQPTLRYGGLTLIRDFERLRPGLPTHAQSNMPGKLVFVSALEQVSREPATLAWLVVLISNAGGVLLYLIVRDLFADRTVAYFALIFYLFVPAKLYFFPVLNTITPVLVLLYTWLWLRALRGGGAPYAAAVGVAVYGVAFFDPLALVMGVLLAAIVPQALADASRPWRTFFRLSGIAAAGFAAAYAAMRWGLQFDLFRTFRAVAADAVSFNAVAQRPYGTWIRQNIWDFLFGIGVSQAVLAALACAYALARAANVRREPLILFCLVIGGILLTTDLIGANRGEVIRLWIFLACFFQVPAAYVCAKLDSRIAVWLVLATTLLQDILGTAMFNFAQP